MGLTTDKNHPELTHGVDNKPVPQAKMYLVLSEAERTKGFARPVKTSYVHVGQQIDTSKMRELTNKEKERYSDCNYIGFIPNEDKDSPVTGRFIKQDDLKKGCGLVTTMGIALAETYARDPKFYGSTYCCHCQMHKQVNEFIWEGTNEKVGT